MINLYVPPKFVALYAVCINDTLPAFEPENWIQKGCTYRVKHMADPLNVTEGTAITIMDRHGREIHASDSHWSFSSSRFDLFSIILN